MSKKIFSILIVDDNRSFVRRINAILHDIEHGISVDAAFDYEQACDHIARTTPDIVLLDIRLPGKNGLKLLEKIRATRPECRVIMNSNYVNEYYRNQCRQLGAAYFLDKTNDFERLPKIIRQLAAPFVGCEEFGNS